jgi:hypothetical protein
MSLSKSVIIGIIKWFRLSADLREGGDMQQKLCAPKGINCYVMDVLIVA